MLIAGVVWSVSAYSTQIWSPIQFVKQLFVTPQGQIDQSKATIKIDGVNGRIDAKSIYENGVQVATKSDFNSAKSYADQKEVEAINAAKNYTNHHVVDGAHIANWAVTTNKIANSAITMDKLSSDLVTKLHESGSQIVTTCNANNIGRHNRFWQTCEYFQVTNDGHCTANHKDGVERDGREGRFDFLCAMGYVREWDQNWIEQTVGVYRRVGFAYVYGFR